MKNKKIYIHHNKTHLSHEILKILKDKILSCGYIITEEYSKECQLIICVGGDGTTLDALHKFNFPETPILGINTGHLGFFQEVDRTTLDDFIFNYNNEDFTIQKLHTVAAIVDVKNSENPIHLKALNEIIIKGHNCKTSHLNLSIDGSFIERFSGDGILVSTAAGSTAYNYSLGGSIVDPRLNILQVTPIAPMNTTAYRSFTSSILLPADLILEISPEINFDNEIEVVADGRNKVFEEVNKVSIQVSTTVVNLLRFSHYDFWNKVKTKFL